MHPTQLYETAIALLVWRVGVKLLGERRAPGTVACVVVAGLALERFAIEFLRAKDDRFFGTFTLALLISLVVLIAALWTWAALRRSPRSSTA